ncbi:hypothetical protein L6164_005485 [Bauhinia variegata]|uniref:Uncharacterized protein n=1 Tax=Bauhinia variegata TaxID=167791 RepID=A0ACB9PSW9_BAUVA|nr:hypothetical protein L6164_005485 [Bauhinia variegata]
MSSKKKESSTPIKHEVSVAKGFDALWFCYTPIHQMQQYYRVGLFDNCLDKWNDLFDCLKLKTKRSFEVQEILEAREKAKPHIWTLRTPEEASHHWKSLFDTDSKESEE